MILAKRMQFCIAAAHATSTAFLKMKTLALIENIDHPDVTNGTLKTWNCEGETINNKLLKAQLTATF